jgi:hypothetical protein
LALIGLLVFVSRSPKGGRSQGPVWVWPLGISLFLGAILTLPFHGLLQGIALIGRISGHEAVIRKWIEPVGTVIYWGCTILVAGSMVGGLVWVAVHLVRGG